MAALLLVLPSCGKGVGENAKIFQMGERVSLGPITYVVLSAEWKTTLGEGLEARMPANRFLLLHVTITNGSGAEVNVPLTQLVDAKGGEHGELQDGKGIQSWLGLLRRVSSTQTDDGYIAFDVPMGPLKLKVSDVGDLENERVAMIEIPVRLEADANGTTNAPLTTMPTVPVNPNSR